MTVQIDSLEENDLWEQLLNTYYLCRFTINS